VVAIEYGKEKRDVIILLHGGGLSWWNFQEAAELLQHRFHVILPILDGHAGSDRSFTDIESNAEEIISYIDREYGGSVALIGGISLGAQILTEMLSQRSDICKYAVIESALAIPMKLTHLLVKPMLNMSYGLIRQEWFAKLQFKSLKLKKELYSNYYRDTCRINKKDMIAFLRSNSSYRAKSGLQKVKTAAYIFVGQRESTKMFRSAQMLNRMLPNSRLKVMKGYFHGDFSANHAEEYAEMIIRIMDQTSFKTSCTAVRLKHCQNDQNIL